MWMSNVFILVSSGPFCSPWGIAAGRGDKEERKGSGSRNSPVSGSSAQQPGWHLLIMALCVLGQGPPPLGAPVF